MTDVEGKITPVGDSLIYKKMAAIMADVPAIGKDQRNQEQRYAFRGVDDVYNALHGLFAKHGVFVIPEVLDAEYIQAERVARSGNTNLVTDAHLRIRYHFYATDGSRVSAVVQGESRDYADKATNQATSSAIKYLLLQVFLIPTQETIEADQLSPIVGEAVVVDRTPSPEERMVNLAKAELLEIMGGDKEKAAAHWASMEGSEPATIVAMARAGAAKLFAYPSANPAVSIDQLKGLVAQPLEGLKKDDLEVLARSLARTAEAAGYIPASERVAAGRTDWLHARLEQVGVAHVATLKVAELRTFVESMQSDVGAALVTQGGEYG